MRLLRRLTRTYVTPGLYWAKRLFPRFVMPGGFIERHLSPLHFGQTYHAVNVMDLARLWRRFPEERRDDVLEDAIRYVVANDNRVLRWWAEAKPRQFAVVVFAEALYHLCMCKEQPAYRKHLAEAIMLIEDLGLGLPPSLLGGNAEIVPGRQHIPCPSPREPHLRVANLSTVGRKELLVVNPAREALELIWERNLGFSLIWTLPEGRSLSEKHGPLCIPARGWLWGRQENTE
jgi:hypothetical protein